MRGVLRLLKIILLSSFSRLDLAELRTYDWDEVFPRGEWHGWCDMIGSPYSIPFDDGESYNSGGWLDVKVLGRLPITAKISAGAGVAGAATLIFQGAMSVYDAVIRDIPTDMQFAADVNGVGPIETHGVIDVQKWNYIRFHGVNNMTGDTITVRVVTHDGVTPIELPEGTGA